MKVTALAGVLATSVFFVDTVGGQPHKLKRGLVTEVVYSTVTIANVIVWVDENGLPYETTTETLASPVESTTAAPPVATPSVEVKPTVAPSLSVASQDAIAPSTQPGQPVPSSAVVKAEPSAAPAAPAPAPPAPAPPPPPAASSSQVPAPPASSPPTVQPVKPVPGPDRPTTSEGLPLGVTYDPFKVGSCKTSDEIKNELNGLKEFGIFRIYGMGCDIIPIAVQVAKANGQKIMAGIYRSADPNNNENIDVVVSILENAIKNYADGNWDIIQLVSVENEKVNSRQMTASDAVQIIRDARAALRSKGYNGPVGAVETVPAMVGNPQICQESDVALVNIHAFFDTHVSAEGAGEFVQGQIEQVKNACNNKRVIVTESGWPHAGGNHDNAVASPEAQKAAIASIRSKFQKDLFLFNAYDSLWKSDDAYTHGAEKFWGIM